MQLVLKLVLVLCLRSPYWGDYHGQAHAADWGVHSALTAHHLHKKRVRFKTKLGMTETVQVKKIVDQADVDKFDKAGLSPLIRVVSSDDKAKGRVAVVITVTKDPDFTKPIRDPNQNPGGFVDGAAILAHSVFKTMSKEYPVDMVAVVTPEVQKMRHILRRIGYKVHESQLGFTSKEIKGKELSTTIDKSGCCGMAEFAKIGAFKLVEYEKVLVLDSDTLMLQNIDELWKAEQEAQYTYDNGLKGGCINGGFAMFKPSLTTYNDLVAMIKEGDFRPGSAWGGSGIGWCYGGQTYQGLIPYFYQKSGKRKDADWRAIDSCVYDSMAANTNDKGVEQKSFPVEKVKEFHFTVCQKPWSCIVPGEPDGMCHAMHAIWWKYRAEYEKKKDMKDSGNSCQHGGRYKPIAHLED